MDAEAEVSVVLASWLVDDDVGAISTTAKLSVDDVVSAGVCVLSGAGVSDVAAGVDDTETAASSGVEDAVSIGNCEWTITTGLVALTAVSVSGVAVVEIIAAEVVGLTVVSGVDRVEGDAVTVTTQVVMVYPTGHWPASSRTASGLAETAVAAPRMAVLSKCWYFIVYDDPVEEVYKRRTRRGTIYREGDIELKERLEHSFCVD